MKKILCLFLSFVLMFSAVSVFAESRNEYDCSAWATESVERAFQVNLLAADKTYDYREEISREAFCELIFNLLVQTPYFYKWYNEQTNGETQPLPPFAKRPFDDTENDAIYILYNHNVVYGKTETEFAPADSLTREEAATILARLLALVKTEQAEAAQVAYADAGQISDWAASAVQKISNLGYMQGVGNDRFAPQDTYTTEQAIVTVVRVFDANIVDWLVELIKMDAGELGYVYENDTWNYVTYDMAVGRRVTPIDADPESFKILETETFAVDKENVYYMSHKIEGADPESFQIIEDTGSMRYAKDKKQVYIYLADSGIREVIGADPETFEVLDFPYAKDKNDAYNGCLPLYVDDVTKFEVTESGTGWVRISYPDSFLTTALNSEEVSKYNNEKYGFIDSAVIYSEEGKAKTEKLVYEGYRIVEDYR